MSAWFKEHPLYDREGQPIVPGDWSFPGRGQVESQLRRAKTTLERADKVLSALPLRGKQAELSARLEDRREQAESAIGYVELYGAYAECEAVYGVDRLLARWDALDDDDREAFVFDPRVIDWPTYVQDIHLPSIVAQARVRTEGGGRTTVDRQERLRKQVLSPDRHLAAFDLENTLIASNVVASYSWLATRRLPADRPGPLRGPDAARGAPACCALDRRDRSDFLRHFYRRYENAPVDQIDADAWQMFSDLILTKSFPAGIRRVREHRALGHRTVLITGALDFVVEPLRPLFDDIVCASLEQKDGRYTGGMTAVPPTGEARAQAMADYAEAEGLSLEESVAYADSASRTCRCSRPSASRWRSTPRPACRPSPASGAGWSSTSTRRPADPARRCPLAARPGGREGWISRTLERFSPTSGVPS